MGRSGGRQFRCRGKTKLADVAITLFAREGGIPGVRIWEPPGGDMHLHGVMTLRNAFCGRKRVAKGPVFESQLPPHQLDDPEVSLTLSSLDFGKNI